MSHTPESWQEPIEFNAREYGWELCNSPEDIEYVPTWRPLHSNMIIVRYLWLHPDTHEAVHLRFVCEPEDETDINTAIVGMQPYINRLTILEAMTSEHASEPFWRIVANYELIHGQWQSQDRGL